MTSKSLAVRFLKAGFKMSLFQRMSCVPVTYMSEPLSATMRPYLCIARKSFCILGSLVLCVTSTLAFKRKRAPIGRKPARCRTGAMRCRINVTIRSAQRHPESMANFRKSRVVHFIVANQTGKYRQSSGVRRGPRIRAPIVCVHIEEGAGGCPERAKCRDLFSRHPLTVSESSTHWHVCLLKFRDRNFQGGS